MKMRKTTQSDQRGIVSILVTIIMMLVITLIVIGFAQVARRNQREALDRQLSTQAYYAAESGVNAAAKYFASNPSTQVDTLSTPNCTGSIGSVSAPIALNGSNVGVTCLMANSQPASLQVAPLTEDSNTVWHVQDSNGNPFTSLKFSWAGNGTTPYVVDAAHPASTRCKITSGSISFPAYGAWNCPIGILRVDLYGTNAGISAANTTSNNNVITLYLIPSFQSGAATATLPGLTDGSGNTIASQRIVTRCDGSAISCSMTLTVPAARQSSEYYARLSMVYQPSDSASLTGADSLGGVKFKAGQAVIDATGRAQDELRRVQVRVPLVRPDTTLPIFGIQTTQNLCKELTVGPTITTSDTCP